MALEDIIQTIEKETKKEIKLLSKKTDEKVALVNQKTETEKARLEKEIKEKAEKEAKSAVLQAEYELRMKQKNTLLDEKQNLLKEALKESLKKLAVLEQNEYQRIVEKLLEGISGDAFSIIPAKGREDETKKALEAVSGQSTLVDETVESIGGFRAVSDNVEIDNTFETLLINQKEELEVEAAKILFSEES